MSSVNQSKIDNLSTNEGLKFHNAWIGTDNVTVNNISVTNPTGDSSQNYSRNWGGFRRLLTINFLLFDDGSDKSTTAQSKITLSEQRNYLNQPSGIIQKKTGGANISEITYRITIYEDGATNTYFGSIEDVTIASQPNEANMLKGSLNLFESSTS